MQTIIGTAKAQGTYGGRKRPRRINTGSRPRNLEGNRPKRRGGHGGGLAAHALGMATRNWKSKGRARPRGKNPRGRGFFPSTLAATMAARGI